MQSKSFWQSTARNKYHWYCYLLPGDISNPVAIEITYNKKFTFSDVCRVAGKKNLGIEIFKFFSSRDEKKSYEIRTINDLLG